MRADTSTEDIAGIAAAVGVLTARGGRTSHAAVVARQMGKVCLVGCTALRIDEKARTIGFGGTTRREGETICLDAENGRVLDGEPQVVVERPEGLLSEVAKWRAGRAVAGTGFAAPSRPKFGAQQCAGRARRAILRRSSSRPYKGATSRQLEE